MSDDIELRRQFVLDLYPGDGWKRKVHGMPDYQVTAIYLREVNKPPKQTKPKKKESGGDDIPF